MPKEKNESSIILDEFFDFLKQKKLTFDVQKELIFMLMKFQKALSEEFLGMIENWREK